MPVTVGSARGESWDDVFIQPNPLLWLTPFLWPSARISDPPHQSSSDPLKNRSDPGPLTPFPASDASVEFWYLRVQLSSPWLRGCVWSDLCWTSPFKRPVLATSFCIGDLALADPSSWNAFPSLYSYPLAYPLLPAYLFLDNTVYSSSQQAPHPHQVELTPSHGTFMWSSVLGPWLDCETMWARPCLLLHHSGPST